MNDNTYDAELDIADNDNEFQPIVLEGAVTNYNVPLYRKDKRVCGLDRRFCAFCPEVPPCAPYQDENGKWHERKWSKRLLRGNTSHDSTNQGKSSIPLCTICTPQQRREWTGDTYCPCLHRATPRRMAIYKEWAANFNRRNRKSKSTRSKKKGEK